MKAPTQAPVVLPCGCARYRFDKDTGKKVGANQVFLLKSGNYICKHERKWGLKVEWIEITQ